ncbi:MAG: hypothetical protein ACPGTU_04890 [Myxococcota bacterium]
MNKFWLSLFCFGCTTSSGTVAPDAVSAIVDPSRTTHFFDLPFPSDDMLDGSGHINLDAYPQAPSDVTRDVIGGWANRISKTSQGFANHGAVYFRFEGALELPSVLTGSPEDPVLLIDTETGELIPLTLRFTEEAGEDPFLADNLLAFAPALGYPPRPGATLVAVVMESAGASAADGWTAPTQVEDALSLAEVDGHPAVATIFTVQNTTGELAALYADVDDRLGENPDWGDIQWQRVTHLDYSPGLTESGEEATLATVTFENGDTEVAFLYGMDNGENDHSHDLLNDWPMAVYQASIPTHNYSGLADRPYMKPGLQHIFDTNEESGWIDFENGMPSSEPDTEMVRLVLSIPKDETGAPIENAPIVVWDHGTGGHAYNSVQRVNVHDDGPQLAERFARAGFAIVGRDAPLYGTRFPLIDEGFSGGSLGFYNVVNLPAFRDNQRQTAVDGHTVRRFIDTGMNNSLTAGSIDTDRVRRFGHSLGSVTSNLGVAPEPDVWESVFLSGTGGVLSHYFLDTGLIDDLGNEFVEQIFTLFQVAPPDPITAPAVLGAALGLPESSWGKIDRLHPSITLFQWTMDPSDPMSVARDEQLPATVFIGIDDHQVPNFTSYALATALPDATVITVEASWDYDPHMVLHREAEGHDVLSDWLEN